MTLIAHWPMTSGGASTTITASVGTDATYNGGDNVGDKLVTMSVAELLNGLDFNGTDDYADISGSSISFADAVAFSAEFVVKPDAINCRVIGRTDTAAAINLQTTTRRYQATGTVWGQPIADGYNAFGGSLIGE